MKYLLFIIPFVGCGGQDDQQSVGLPFVTKTIVADFKCQELEKSIDSKDLCAGHVECKVGSSIRHSIHLCVCSGSCICFVVKTDGDSDCASGLEKSCTNKGGNLYILGEDFCLVPRPDRTKAFFNFEQSM